MSDEYTPTTEQVLGGYIFDQLEIGGVAVDKSTAQFTRWLESHDREVAEKALKEIGFELNGLMDSLDDSVSHEQIYEALAQLKARTEGATS